MVLALPYWTLRIFIFVRGAQRMFSWALTFLVLGLIAGLLGFTGIAGTATHIAWILFVVGIVLALIFAATGKTRNKCLLAQLLLKLFWVLFCYVYPP